MPPRAKPAAVHPNRLAFQGIICRVGLPSDKAPSGARGHRVILTPEAAAEAMPSLLGMAVAFKDGFEGHNARCKCGVITDAELVEDALLVRGYLYDRDFPEVADAIRQRVMGMSYELCEAHIDDMRQMIWTITRATFTGAAILLCEKAAYKSTTIQITSA